VSLEEDTLETELDIFVDAHQGLEEAFFDALQPPLAKPVFSFHVPPESIVGFRCWPGCDNSQSHSATAKLAPNLFDAWVHVQAHLEVPSRLRLNTAAKQFSYGVLCSPLWIAHPWQPHRRRRHGFGAVSKDRSVTTDCPTFFHVFHHLWSFLSSCKRRRCQQMSPLLLQCSFQPVHAAMTSAFGLLDRLRPSLPSLIDLVPASLAVLCFDLTSFMAIWFAG
jgi:hypothetical protein